MLIIAYISGKFSKWVTKIRDRIRGSNVLTNFANALSNELSRTNAGGLIHLTNLNNHTIQSIRPYCEIINAGWVNYSTNIRLIWKNIVSFSQYIRNSNLGIDFFHPLENLHNSLTG